MVVFPNCKINLGLNILRRRPDGYHDIETVMYPVPWTDILEVVPAQFEDTLTVTGNGVDCPPEKNLVIKAVRALRAVCDFPAVDIHLHKIVPDGAGLGGGSSDAAFTLTAINGLFGLGLTDAQLADVAATIGSDCPFFVYNRPMLSTGRGTDLAPVDVSLSGLWLVIVKDKASHVSTAQAYAGVTPDATATPVAEIIQTDVQEWSGALVNKFEESVFAVAPEVAAIKYRLADAGAIYTAMTGSGAAVFGLFDRPVDTADLTAQFAGCAVFAAKMA